MIKSFKFRIYPNKEQEQLIQKTFGCVRFVYNYFLTRREEEYDQSGLALTNTQCSKELTSLKKVFIWLNEVDKWALQNAIRNLNEAYSKFFKTQKRGPKITPKVVSRLARLGKKPTRFDLNGHPKYKSKFDTYKSYRTTFNNNNIKVCDKIQLPKLGWVKYRDSRNCIDGRILNATVIQEPSGKYYCSVCCDIADIQYAPPTNKYVGIDLGISHLVVTSDAIIYANPRFTEKLSFKLRHLDKAILRKPYMSNNHHKARLRYARCFDHIKNQRRDYLQKLTTDLVRTYDVICLENLSIMGMLKDKILSSEISDVAWYMIKTMLKYKSEWCGKELVTVDRFYPSSQLCSNCGYKNEKVKDLSIREWTCPNCGSHHDRDINAAINILNEGKRILGIE